MGGQRWSWGISYILYAWPLGRLDCAIFVPLHHTWSAVNCLGVRVLGRAPVHPGACGEVLRPGRRPLWAAAGSAAQPLPCADQCPPWGQTLGKGLARPRGHRGMSWAPCYRSYRCCHRDHKHPLAILLTVGSWGRKSSSRPALGGPAGLQQWPGQPAANPGLSPGAFPTPSGCPGRKGAWPWRWEPRLQPPTASSLSSGPGLCWVPSQTGSLSHRTRGSERGGTGPLGVHGHWLPLLGADPSES